MHRGVRRNKGSAGRPKRTVCDIRGDYVGTAVSDAGAVRLLVAAMCMQAVEDVRTWRARGVLCGRRIVADLVRWNATHRLTGGEKTSAADVTATIDFLSTGRAERLLRLAEIPYHLPRVV
jgi:hypothetical protein